MADEQQQQSAGAPDHYDRSYGMSTGFPHTKPSIVTAAGVLGVGGVRRFIVQTFRAPDAGDTIFVEIIGPGGSDRFVLPPPVSNAISSQRDALSKRARKAGAKQAAKTRRAKGIKPFERKAKS